MSTVGHTMKLLEGTVAEIESNHSDEEIESLHQEIADLRRDLSQARREAMDAKRETASALGALRKQLNPLYRALQSVFGELDAAGVDDAPLVNSSSRTAAVWQAWKDRIGGQPAKLIDALLLHGEMTASQIAIAIQVSPKNVAQVVHKLNKASLLQKNGNKFSLKQL